jgi:hypothetical protein
MGNHPARRAAAAIAVQLRLYMHPDQAKLPLLQLPAELIEAAKAHKRMADTIAITAEKWSDVADIALSWSEPTAYVLLGLAGMLALAILRKWSDAR